MKKRTVIVAAGVVALGVAVYVGRLSAQPGGRPAPGGTPAPAAQPKTRVAFINLAHVVKNYDKFKAYQEELKKDVKPFQDKDALLKTEVDKLGKQLSDPKKGPPTAADKDRVEGELKVLQRRIEDNKADAQKALAKKQDDQLRILYKDVQWITERYAVGHNFDVVMHYNDAVEEADLWNPQNIARKMNAPALMPMYFAKGLDVSQDIINSLNNSYKASQPKPAPAAGGTR